MEIWYGNWPWAASFPPYILPDDPGEDSIGDARMKAGNIKRYLIIVVNKTYQKLLVVPPMPGLNRTVWQTLWC